MNTKWILCIMMFFMVGFMSCESDEELQKLPEATTSGKNTFGCKINGKVWRPYSKPFGSRLYDVLFEDNSIVIQAWVRDDNCSEWVEVYADNIFKEGSYQIPGPDFNGVMHNICRGSSDCGYRVLPENSNITITRFDKSNRIISGTFEYKDMFNRCDTTDIIQITEGRFDFRF
jgi:hypothetical protein